MDECSERKDAIPEQFCICGLCGESYNEPKQLGCLHSFCRACLIYYARNLRSKNVQLQCPTCQTTFHESRDSFKDLPDDNFIKLLMQISTSSLDLNNFQEDANYYSSLGEYDKKRNNAKIKVQMLKNKSDMLCRDILTKKRSDEGLKDRLTQEIKSYYEELSLKLSEHLKKQELKLIDEVNTLIENREEKSDVNMSRGRSVLQIMENRDQLLGNMDSNLFRTFPPVIVDCLLKELDKQIAGCYAILNELGMRSDKLKFVANDDVVEYTLRYNFGKISKDDSNFSRSISRSMQGDPSDSLLVPGNRSSESSDVCYDTDCRSYQSLEANLSEQTSDGLLRHTQETENSSCRDQTMQRQRSNIAQADTPIPIPQNNATTSPTEELPSYWDVVCDHISMRRISIGETSKQTGTGNTPSNVQPTRRHVSTSSTIFRSGPLKYAKHLRSVRVQLPDDKNSGPVVGIAWLHNLVVVVDRWNKKLKLFSENGNFIHSLVFADGDPWDVVTTHLLSPANSTALCAVTVPMKKIILQIAVRGTSLEITNRIVTPSGYTCLAFDKTNSVFVCGVSQPFGPSQVDVITMTGQVVACFAVDARGKQLFSQVRSIDILEKGIISVCDWNRNCVFFLTPTGIIFSRYKGTAQYPMMEPVGTTVDDRGFLMIADTKSDRIHIVDKDGKLCEIMKASCAIVKPKEINIRPYGPPMLALSHGKHYIELFQLHTENDTNVVPTAPDLY